MYDRTTTRLVEKNYRAYRLFTKPAPTTPPAPAPVEVHDGEASA